MGIEPLADYSLASLTRVQTGGNAEYFARVEDLEQLHELRAWAAAREMPINVIGMGSNVLVADEGVAGLVVRLEGEFTRIEVSGTSVVCGGGALFPMVVRTAALHGLSGLEFGDAIPGSIGGAIRMNANAYDGELKETLSWVDVDRPEGLRRLRPDELSLRYRASNIVASQIVVAARFELKPASPEFVMANIKRLRHKRNKTQPQGRTLGSTFVNPPKHAAWELLKAAGVQQLHVGEARFSDKHANFVVTRRGATTDDVIELIATARALVKERTGVTLDTEVVLLGAKKFPWQAQPASERDTVGGRERALSKPSCS